MDFLDEPLDQHILSALAGNIAQSAGSVEQRDDLAVILDGLPLVDDADEEDDWSDAEINHAIAFAHYVSSLESDSPYLASSLPRLRLLLTGLIRQGIPTRQDVADAVVNAPGSDNAPGGATNEQALLLTALLKAVLWVGWSQEALQHEGLRADVGMVVANLLESAEQIMTSALVFSGVILTCVHSVLSHVPLPPLPTPVTARVVSAVIQLGTPTNLVKAVREAASPNTPAFNYPKFNTAPYPTCPSAVALLVTEITNVVLASAIQPPPEVDHAAFVTDPEATFPEGVGSVSTVWRNQTKALLAEPAVEIDLDTFPDGQQALDAASDLASAWWKELNDHDPSGFTAGTGVADRRSTMHSSYNDNEIQSEEDVYLTVSVLHLLNLLSLHQDDRLGDQLARLKLLLSENSTVSDARVLQAAFVCLAIVVRNHPSLGTSLTHHLRRLFMSPLPGLENELSPSGGDVSPTIAAASTCLAMCIEMSSNDDAISSTLYSLLGVLNHGTTIGPGQNSIRSIPLGGVGMSDGKSFQHSGKRTDEQRKLISANAVEIVSRLALDTGRDDIIHLAISMLLQRVRGVDIATESAIVSSLVPLALAASDEDLQEVYRAFSQIARSSNPEDPRLSSNAVLAAQTTLAKGLGTRLRAADGFLQELLTDFADQGTQTQIVYMGAQGGHEGRDRDKKTALLRSNNEKRAADMKAQLAAFLLPIAEILSHRDYHPEINPSQECVALFRNFWLLCVVFNLSGSRSQLSEHEAAALATIAEKTPVLVLEKANDFVGSELEYNTILRKDFAHSIHTKLKAMLTEVVPNKFQSDIRGMSTPQLAFSLAINDLEEMRTLRYRPSTILQYFCNDSINRSILVTPLTGIAIRLTNSFLKQLSVQVVEHNMPSTVPEQVCKILVACTHRMRKVREVALAYASSILKTFTALLCDRRVIFTLLEILTLMRRSCEMQYTDEYSPIHYFRSERMPLQLELTDDYAVRNEIVTNLYNVARLWLTNAISRAPIEVQSMLQSYLNESRDVLLVDSVEMGAGLALHFCKAISRLDRQESLMPTIGGWPSDNSNLVASQFAAKNYYDGELSGARLVLDKGLDNLEEHSRAVSSLEERQAFMQQMQKAIVGVNKKGGLSVSEIRRLLLRAVSVLIASPQMDPDILHYLVELPFAAFTPVAVAAGVDAWSWLLRQRPDAEVSLMGEISAGWLATIKAHKGMFSTSMNYTDPFEKPVEYSPTDKRVMDVELRKAERLLKPHLLLIQVLSSSFQAVKYRASGIMISLARMLLRSLHAYEHWSTHPLAREVRFNLLLFGFQVLASSRMETLLELRYRDALFRAAFSWFAVRPQWSFGSNRVQVGAEIKLLQDFIAAVRDDHIRADHWTTSMNDRQPVWTLAGSNSLQEYCNQHRDRVRLMELLIENEINRLNVWVNPGNDRGRTISTAGGSVEASIGNDEWTSLVRKAWKQSPAVAVQMGERFKHQPVWNEITRLVRGHPRAVLNVAEAMPYFIGDKFDPAIRGQLKYALIWAALPPVEALNLFQPRYNSNPILLQYAMRVLEHYPVDLTFFFVPQVVQGLRYDALGYVERFIFETSKISQLFCHQIIWNMKANTYRDDNGEEPDPMKPQLDRMVDKIVASLSGKAQVFYEQEFGFFADVTSISGKLKPYIKKTKPEKKAKIDEEMAKIKLEVGVYLPSNPDGVVVDLDRKSGRPLQSHAKAPFMATFKVRKQRIDLEAADLEAELDTAMATSSYDVWQSAIFKVGDDCRQDVLALQLIAMFKNVFTQLGLTLYLFPYRVTATAPGCGVIDVVPNATSRDEMGRAQVNDLLEYFIDKYGGVDTVAFQKARLNFIQSMAAYSVACYILQIKDRHNGNIMIDGEGHIVHIDFGFLFDIGPGGIKFEAGSFKLNKEMIALMGGAGSQGYSMFVDLTIKAFLAIRPYVDQLCDTVALMLGTGLPSFKDDGTINRLRDRFAPNLNERAAADYMMGVINNAYQNKRSDIYDGFQKLQNGIPY